MSSDRRSQLILDRDCEATIIPNGEKVILRHGEIVMVTQALGGTLTVQTERGQLARIGAADTLALGYGVPKDKVSLRRGNRVLATRKANDSVVDTQDDGVIVDSGVFEFENVMKQLKTVFDPEIPINVVDLGLIYSCDAQPLASGGHRVEIKMSMTAPGCGMGDVLKDDARARVLLVSGISEVDVELVWDPPWDSSRMSDAAKLQLGMY